MSTQPHNPPANPPINAPLPPTSRAHTDAHDQIELRGVSTHNLKGFDLDVPHRALTVITGVSGSGKSSLAFETLYAEGQRRFVESMSTYARQFLQRMQKPPLKSIRNVLPAIAMRQKHVSAHARSTIGTLTELDDHLQMLYARLGQQLCVQCGKPVTKGTADGIAAQLQSLGDGAKLILTANVTVEPPETPAQTLARLVAEGHQRLWGQGKAHDLSVVDPELLLDADAFDVLVDRVIIRAEGKARLLEAVEVGLRLGKGVLRVWRADAKPDAAPLVYREGLACDACGTAHAALIPSLFNPNTTLGACPVCTGFGRTTGIDYDKVIPNAFRTIEHDAVAPFATPSREREKQRLLELCKRKGVDIKKPWIELGPEDKRAVMNGDKYWGGVKGFFKKLEGKRTQMSARITLARFRGYSPCDACDGARLGTQAQAVHVAGTPLHVVQQMTAAKALAHMENLNQTLPASERAAARSLLEEILLRLRYMNGVGLGYLRLDRQTRTLSGGEFQRLHLTSSVGRALSDTLYVLDEPTAGLHARDSQRLLLALRGLRDQGNTVVVVEHDPELITGADWVVELGPMGGERGGQLLYVGALKELLHTDTPTGRMLSRRLGVQIKHTSPSEDAGKPKRGKAAIGRHPAEEPPAESTDAAPTQHHGVALRVTGATEHNLQNLSVTFPSRKLVAITGVSGSGKSTLVHDIIYQSWCARAGDPTADPGHAESIEGFEQFSELVMMTQNPLGRSSRSNAATSTKAFDAIRKCFSSTPEAEAAGITNCHFSFNTEGGRCETCEGTGLVVVEMQFMADIELPCDACQGRRFKPEVLEIRYKGLSIDQALHLTIDEAIRFFGDKKPVINKLQPLADVGLGYIRLGQSTSTLSGGELQRLKLAAYLPVRAKKADEKGKDTSKDTKAKDDRPCLFIFDEPTTGLHLQDIEVLLRALRRLVVQGHSVLVVEHNTDFIAACDHIIDLGPEGGDGGGQVVVEGSPSEVAACEASYTGQALRDLFRELGQPPA